MDLYDKYSAALEAEDALQQSTEDELYERYSSQVEGSVGAEPLSKGSAYDGDTTYVDGKGRRLQGGDTTELKLTDRSAAPLSIEARNRANELLDTGEFEYYDSGEEDHNGRSLGRYRNSEGVSITETLIREGLSAPAGLGGQELGDLQAYADYARSDGKIKGVRDYGTQVDWSADEYDTRNLAERAWARGTDMMQMNLHQFAELVGSSTGVDMLTEWGEEGVYRNMGEAARSPAEIESTDDIKNYKDVGYYVLERMIENAPNILADIGIAGAAAAATVGTGGLATLVAPAMAASIGKSFVGKLGWRAAGKVGFTGSMYAQMAGESRHGQLQQGVDNPALAFGVGAAKTGLEYYGIQSILKGLVPKGRITNPAALAGHIMKQAGLNTGTEGITEFSQDLADQLAIKMAKPDYEIDWDQLNESFWAGAAAGGGTSATGATIVGGVDYALNASRRGDINTDANVDTAPAPIDVDTNTIPETPAAQRAQLTEVLDPATKRDAALFPQGLDIPQEDIPEGVKIQTHEDGSTIATNNEEKLARHAELGAKAAKEILGYSLSKEELAESSEPKYVATRRDVDGNEMESEVIVESMAKEKEAEFQEHAREGDVVEVVPEEKSTVLQERKAAMAADLRNTSGLPDSPEEALKNVPEAQEKPVNRVEHTEAPQEEQNTVSVFNEDGELRSPEELIADTHSGRLDVEVIAEELRKLGLDPSDDLTTTAAMIDRRKTIEALLNAGKMINEFLLPMAQRKSGKANLRGVKELLADQSLTEEKLLELAQKHGVAPIAVTRFNINALIAKMVRQITRNKDLLPDDVRAVSWLFQNPESELYVETAGMDYKEARQARRVYTERLKPVMNPREVINAHLDKSKSAEERTEAAATLAEQLNVTVSSKERVENDDGRDEALTREIESPAVKMVQRLHNFYSGKREGIEQPAKPTEATYASEESQLEYESEERVVIEKAREHALDAAVVNWFYKEAGITAPQVFKENLGELIAEAGDTVNPATIKEHIARVIDGNKAAAEFYVELFEKETSDAERMRLLSGNFTQLDDRALYGHEILDGFRPSELWNYQPDHADANNKHTKKRARPANVKGEGNQSAQLVSPEHASATTFTHSVRAAEVRVREGATTPDAMYTFGDPTLQGRDSTSSIKNTRIAEGKNLIVVERVTPGVEDTVEMIYMDAARLVQIGLGTTARAESGSTHSNVVIGLDRAVERMGDFGFADEGLSHIYRLHSPLRDDLVVHFNSDTTPVTLGEMRKRSLKENANNRRWKQSADRQELIEQIKKYQVQFDVSYYALLEEYDKKGGDAKLKPALRWMEEQMEYSAEREKAENPELRNNEKAYNARFLGEVDQANEERHTELTRKQVERDAVKSLAPDALHLNQAIVSLWSEYRAGVHDDDPNFIENQRDARDQEILERGSELSMERAWDDEDNSGVWTPETNGEVNEEALSAEAKAMFDIYGDRGAEFNQQKEGFTPGKQSPSVGPRIGDTTAEQAKPDGTSKANLNNEHKWKPKKLAQVLFSDKKNAVARRSRFIYRLLDFAHNTLRMKLPVVVIAKSDLAAGKLKEIDNKTRVELRKHMQNGERGAFMSMDDYGIIVLDDNLSRAETLAVMSHELGHALFESMRSDYQDVLSAAYVEAHGLNEGQTPNPEKLREWIADQVAHYIASWGSAPLEDNQGPFKNAMQRIARALVQLWHKATKELMRYGEWEGFESYFDAVLKDAKKGKYVFTRKADTGVYNLSAKDTARKMRATGAKAKQLHKEHWRPITAVLRSVASRIRDYSDALSKELYQPSQTLGPEGYEQIQRFLHNEAQSRFAILEKRIGEAAMKQAFKDLRAGKMTANARAVRSTIDEVNALMKKYNPLHMVRDNFIPEAFDHAAIEKNRETFEKMLVDAEIFDQDQVTSAVQDLMYSDAISDYSLAPGKAVSTHQSVDRILSKIGSKKLMEAGFLLDNPHAIMSHYIATAAKRTAWEHKFGGYTSEYQGDLDSIRLRLLDQHGIDTKDMSVERARALVVEIGLEKDGEFYSPNKKVNDYFDTIREQYGESGVKATKELLDSALGRAGHDIAPALRTSFEWVTTFMNLTLLAFSGVASIPELAGSVIRARGQLSLADFKDVLLDMKQSREFATDLGIILTDGAEQMALETMGAQYTSPLQHKITQTFFKYNGQQFITRLSRTLALSTGKRFILNAMSRAEQGDTKAVEELAMIHIKPEDIRTWVDSGMPSDNLAVNKALNQFVFESSIMPSKFEATKWGNNPYWKLAWHLKQFFYSFGTVIVGGIARHMHQRYQDGVAKGNIPAGAAAMAAMPLIIAGAAFLPLAALSEELREFIKGKDRTNKMDNASYMRLLASKTGALGPFEMLSSMEQAYSWNKSPIAAMTPTTSFIETMVSMDVSGEKKLKRLVPFYSQGAFTWLFD